MSLSVLIANRDLDWSSEIKKELESELYNVHFAQTGKQAQIALYHHKIYAIILSWSIENHSAQEVIAFIRQNHPSVIIIVKISSLEDIEESVEEFQELHRVSAVVTDQTDGRAVIELLESTNFEKTFQQRQHVTGGVSEEVTVDESDDQYCAIKVDELYSSRNVLFDIFVKLRAHRYIKILHAGDAFSEERLDKYKLEKKVEYFYFHKKDRKKFIQFNNLLTKKFISSEKVDSETKVGAVKNIISNYVESIQTEGLSPNSLALGSELSGRVYELVEKDDDLYSFFRNLSELDPKSYNHAFLVTLYATATTRNFDWQSSKTLQAVALAGMLHDIGKTKLPPEIVAKKEEEMTEDELHQYQEHPTLGFEILDACKGIENSVKQMVLQHHEAYDGTGYPRGLKGSKILLVANILCLVDDFLHLMENQGTSPVETAKLILHNEDMMRKYNGLVIENFIKVFANPDKIKKEASSATLAATARKLSS